MLNCFWIKISDLKTHLHQRWSPVWHAWQQALFHQTWSLAWNRGLSLLLKHPQSGWMQNLKKKHKRPLHFTDWKQSTEDSFPHPMDFFVWGWSSSLKLEAVGKSSASRCSVMLWPNPDGKKPIIWILVLLSIKVNIFCTAFERCTPVTYNFSGSWPWERMSDWL